MVVDRRAEGDIELADGDADASLVGLVVVRDDALRIVGVGRMLILGRERSTIPPAMTKTTKTAAAIALALGLAACSFPKPTPYQPLQHTNGFDDVVPGGYRETPMGPGQWTLVVQVNKYTSSEMLIQYVHRRAGELCPSGFEFGSNVVEKDGFGRTTATVVLGCAAPPTDPEIEQAVATTEPKPKPFFCAVSSADPNVSACAVGEGQCVEQRDAAFGDQPMGTCKVADAVTCIDAVRVSDGQGQRWCTATVGGCVSRESSLKADASFRDVGGCTARSKAE